MWFLALKNFIHSSQSTFGGCTKYKTVSRWAKENNTDFAHENGKHTLNIRKNYSNRERDRTYLPKGQASLKSIPFA